MLMVVKTVIALAFLIYSPISFGQNVDDTLILSGNVSLDFGVAAEDYTVEVSVSNHSIIISPISLAIIRPLTSRVTQSVTIPQGQSSIDYLLEGISTDAIDYVIDYRCENCNGVFTPQYYTKTGNSFSINNDVYIDPDDLPNNLDFTLTSGTSISGEISLADNKNARRDLIFLLSLKDSTNPISVFRRISIIIPKGSNSIAYSIDQLTRETGLVGFNLELECLTCLNTSSLLFNFPNTLDSSIDHMNIDFKIDFQGINFFPALYHLLDETNIN